MYENLKGEREGVAGLPSELFKNGGSGKLCLEKEAHDEEVFSFAVVVVLLCFSTSVWGQDDVREGGYIGIGGSYAVEDFDFDGPSPYDSTWGLNVRAGYDFTKWLSLEFDFCYLPDFTEKGSFSMPFPESDPPVTLPAVDGFDLTVTTYMVVAKVSPPLTPTF